MNSFTLQEQVQYLLIIFSGLSILKQKNPEKYNQLETLSSFFNVKVFDLIQLFINKHNKNKVNYNEFLNEFSLLERSNELNKWAKSFKSN